VTRYLHLARHGEAVDEEAGLTSAGREQARHLAQRMAAAPLAAIHHSPLPRAVETAGLIGAACAGVPVRASELLGDYVPPVPDAGALPEVFKTWLGGLAMPELAAGAELARAATARFAVPASEPTHELIVTHAFLIGWFVRHALGAPDDRWLGLNHANCAVTTILYRPARPPALMVFNDQSHLPPALRWTGFPPELTVP
jgi:probable phosphoglycerate mutase